MEAGYGQPFQRGQAGRHGDRVPGQRSGLVDRTEGGQLLHDVAAPAEGAHRHAAADDLAERGQVRANAVALLRATARDAEAGHHLVEDQHRAVPGAQLAHALQEAGSGRDAVHVAGHRLDDDTGELAAHGGEALLQRFGIVVGQGDRVAREVGRHAGRGGHAERQRARSGLHQQRVGVAVVAAFELHHLVTIGESAREADGAHRRLGAGAAHADQLDGGHQLDDPPGEHRLDLRRGAEGQPVCDLLADRIDHGRVCVPEDHRAPGSHVVDEAAAIGRFHPGAGGAGEEDRLAAHSAEGTDR